MTTRPWRMADAEAHLLSLELFGMRFGLDRMRRLLTVLGTPQEAYSAIHVVGTNGKSSTARMCAALLEAHGVRTGTFLSPHLVSFAERIRIGDADLDPDAFATAVQRAAAAAAKVDRTLEPGDRVTQFELFTAAALAEFVRRPVDVAVVEAGLGGRHDATNVLGAPTVVLTNVGLEHTRWLGPTILDIAREKLAVVRPGATLVMRPLQPEVEEEARRTGARIVRPDDGLEVTLPGFQRLNFATAAKAAEAHLGRLRPELVADVAARIAVPGRLERVAGRPLTILDGAHNPSGMEALVAALPDAIPGRSRLIAVVAILDDKDAAGMLRALLPHLAGAVFSRSSNPRALPPATLASLAEQLDGPPSEIVADPHEAVARARALAGPDGAVLATGSIYLVADLVSEPGRRRASAL
jgi:dihydrofolate synthase / folylpolyglutamate synthase